MPAFLVHPGAQQPPLVVLADNATHAGEVAGIQRIKKVDEIRIGNWVVINDGTRVKSGRVSSDPVFASYIMVELFENGVFQPAAAVDSGMVWDVLSRVIH